jgi:N-acetyl-anhydromuramyl-L-alanine amidase AmpD
LDGTVAWFQNPQARVSAHYVIGKDGSIVQMVSLDRAAWHAGQSSLPGCRGGVNPCSIGIEIVNWGTLTKRGDMFLTHSGRRYKGAPPILARGTYWEPFTDAQYESLLNLTKHLLSNYPGITHITGHEDIAPGRKNDPGGAFDWDRIRSVLHSLFVGHVGPLTATTSTSASTPPSGINEFIDEYEEEQPETDLELNDAMEFLDPERDDSWQGEVNRSSKDYIRWVQESLNRILGLRLTVDGIMGPQTRSAIRSFQQKQGLTVDGNVGPNTEAALIKATGGGMPGPVIMMPTDTIKPAAARLWKFDKNSAKLKESHMPDIEKVADRVVASWKAGQPIFTIYVKGHTSSEGPAQYNISLGNQRALAVRKALQKALERKQKNLSYKVLILALSKGAKEPIGSNETEEGRLQNRRVEVFLSTKALLPKKPPKPPTPPPLPGMKDIPWIWPWPDLRTPKLPTDDEPLCDLPSYKKEVEKYKRQHMADVFSCALRFAKTEWQAVKFARLAAGVASLPGLIAAAAAAGIIDTYAKVQLARCAYGAMQTWHERVKAAKVRWHCL